MRFIGFFIALTIALGVLAGIGYGVYEIWGYLSGQWFLLDTAWRPTFILLSSVIVFCSMLVVILVRSGFRKHLGSSYGKTVAYSNFMNWYSDANNKNYSELNAEQLISTRNDFLLWAGNNVVKHYIQLYEELGKTEPDPELIERYAKNIHVEILRDLGRRGGDKSRQL